MKKTHKHATDITTKRTLAFRHSTRTNNNLNGHKYIPLTPSNRYNSRESMKHDVGDEGAANVEECLPFTPTDVERLKHAGLDFCCLLLRRNARDEFLKPQSRTDP